MALIHTRSVFPDIPTRECRRRTYGLGWERLGALHTSARQFYQSGVHIASGCGGGGAPPLGGAKGTPAPREAAAFLVLRLFGAAGGGAHRGLSRVGFGGGRGGAAV